MTLYEQCTAFCVCEDDISRRPGAAQELLRTPRALGRGLNVSAVEAHLESGSTRLLRVFHRRLVIGVAPASKILSGRTLSLQRLDRVRSSFCLLLSGFFRCRKGHNASHTNTHAARAEGPEAVGHQPSNFLTVGHPLAIPGGEAIVGPKHAIEDAGLRLMQGTIERHISANVPYVIPAKVS